MSVFRDKTMYHLEGRELNQLIRLVKLGLVRTEEDVMDLIAMSNHRADEQTICSAARRSEFFDPTGSHH